LYRFNPNLKIFTHVLLPGNKVHLEQLGKSLLISAAAASVAAALTTGAALCKPGH
jgi:hypothetical protein